MESIKAGKAPITEGRHKGNQETRNSDSCCLFVHCRKKKIMCSCAEILVAKVVACSRWHHKKKGAESACKVRASISCGLDSSADEGLVVVEQGAVGSQQSR